MLVIVLSSTQQRKSCCRILLWVLGEGWVEGSTSAPSSREVPYFVHPSLQPSPHYKKILPQQTQLFVHLRMWYIIYHVLGPLHRVGENFGQRIWDRTRCCWEHRWGTSWENPLGTWWTSLGAWWMGTHELKNSILKPPSP